MRGHVASHFPPHIAIKQQLTNLRFEQIKIWRVKETLSAVAGVAAAVREPWLAEASQDRHARRHHLLEDNPSSG